MGILEDINPRRFFYVKHFLALRMVLTMKLERLEHSVNRGWVAASDIENLQEDLEERLAQVQHFFPTIAGGDADPARAHSLAKCHRGISTESLSSSVDRIAVIPCKERQILAF